MTDSPEIQITVKNPVEQTYIIYFDMQPRSGLADFNVIFQGWLSRFDAPEHGYGAGNVINGEVIRIFYVNPHTGAWEDTGVYAMTAQSDDTGTEPRVGYFRAEIGILASWLPPGTYRFRAQYAGNAAKNLSGCEKNG